MGYRTRDVGTNSVENFSVKSPARKFSPFYLMGKFCAFCGGEYGGGVVRIPLLAIVPDYALFRDQEGDRGRFCLRPGQMRLWLSKLELESSRGGMSCCSREGLADRTNASGDGRWPDFAGAVVRQGGGCHL